MQSWFYEDLIISQTFSHFSQIKSKVGCGPLHDGRFTITEINSLAMYLFPDLVGPRL